MIKVTTPGSIANIGPGFDTLGCALDIYATVCFDICDTVRIEGCDDRYAGRDNLVYKAFCAVMSKAERAFDGVYINIDSEIPVSRGLGSSSAMIVSGAAAANHMAGHLFSREQLFQICAEVEGHPDNVAPAIFGGLTASASDNRRALTAQYSISDKIVFTALVPDFETSTGDARAALPQAVPFKDAVFNVSRTALLLKALENGDFSLISFCCQDTLHQPYRKHLIPGFDRAQALATARGAAAFVISGSGSTCMCMSEIPLDNAALEAQLAAQGLCWQVRTLKADSRGVFLQEV